MAVNGLLEFQVYTAGQHNTQAGIKQVQLEQDSGRSLHAGDYSLIDLNRAGIPLMEIVFEPDLRNSDEAAALIKELCLILKTLETCNCKMEGNCFNLVFLEIHILIIQRESYELM